jgi:predicted transcriptional regulator
MEYFEKELNIKVFDSILLNIQSVHAEKIYKGTKLYELRKTIPTIHPNIVFLYEQKKKVISGAFIVDSIIQEEINELWEIVGINGTSKDRFFEYYKGYKKGYAYKILHKVKFSQEVKFKDILNIEPNFIHPQSFLYLKNFPNLFEFLQKELNKVVKVAPSLIQFEKPDLKEQNLFIEMAYEEIRKKYDEIDASFAENIVNVSKLDEDPNGYFTFRKILYAIKINLNLIGFIVITEKRGNCIKTGPSILLNEYRNLGIGPFIRAKIEEVYKVKGFRKIYCTCNSKDSSVINYLLKSNMRIEAHLFNQYSKEGSELIFGKLLVKHPKCNLKLIRSQSKSTIISEFTAYDTLEMTDFLSEHFSKSYFNIDNKFIKRLLENAQRSNEKSAYSSKPKSIFISRTSYGSIKIVSICSPKRGGSVKLNFISETINSESVKNNLSYVVNYYKTSKTKIFTTIPTSDLKLLQLLEEFGFQKEGLLIEPYQNGVDMFFLSYFII